jgi:hypothetical protein
MHPVGQLTPADPTVGLQDADDSSVDSVKYRRFNGHSEPVCQRNIR